MSSNQMAIHTSTGCTVSGADCSQGSGCTVTEKQTSSYGQAFATAGGGVWATQFDTTGIKCVLVQCFSQFCADAFRAASGSGA